ncbi:MAG: signal peptidase I [Deltaproteobacteria bacterium]|nr:signal peptidase I [Deltaproteobacteria bacterium]
MASLRSSRRDAKDLLKEVKGLTKKQGKKVPAEGFSKVAKAQDELETAIRGNQPDQIVGLTRKLDELTGQVYAGLRKSHARQYIESIGSAVLVAVLLRLFVVEMFKIPSGSMVPTLQIGDHLFISKFIYGIRIPFVNSMLVQWHNPQPGDVIVFNSPIEPDKDLIKRVAAVPGDKIEVRNDIVFVNGQMQPRRKVKEDYQYWDYDENTDRWFDETRDSLWEETLGKETHAALERRDILHAVLEGPFTVPPGQIFVLGDNRDNSADSRFNGGWTVPYGNIKGKAFIIMFSWGKGGWWFCHEGGFPCTESGLRLDRFFKGIP